MRTITKSEYEYAKQTVKEYEAREKKLSKHTGYSICPFCSGTKTKPFMRQGVSQDCTDCNKNGLISNRTLVDLDLRDFINQTP